MKRIRSIVLVAFFAASAFGFLRGEAPSVQTGTWAPGPAMSVLRSGAASVLMANGRVLVTGGVSGSDVVASTDVFDPFRGFAADAPMNNARADHAAVTLTDGSVLVIGGRNVGGAVASAEIYAAGAWSEVGALTEPRWGHTATLLADGRVLVAGGESAAGLAASVEVFDPATAAFDLVGTLSSLRKGHAAARLNDGRVLIAGGFDGQQVLPSIDVFDPINGSFTAGPSLLTARAGLTATTLLDGKVLLFGGYDGTNELASSEVLDPVTATVTAGPTAALARRDHRAFRLPNNNSVLIAGGVTSGAATASAELYVPGVNQFWAATSMSVPRASATGSPLMPESYGDPVSTDGLLLVAGGIGLSSSELYGFATIRADKDDYSPGQEMSVSGSGWQPGETVSFALRELPNEHDTRFFTVTADPVTGAIPRTKLFDVEPHHLGVRFYLTATGAASRAVTTFTDSNPQNINVGAPTSVSVAPGTTAVFGTVTVTKGGNDNPCTITLGVTPALPSGATAVFGNSPLVMTTGDVTSSFSVTTTAATPPGVYNFTVTGAKTGAGCQGGGPSPSGTLTLTVAKRVGTVTVGSQTGTLTSGTAGSATYTVTVTRNGATGTAFNVNLSVTSALPAGATSSFSSPGSTLSFAANDTSKTATLTVGTTAPTPAGSTEFTVQASNPNVAGDSSTGAGTLTVDAACAAPSITGQPFSQSITYGDPATFTAAASGDPTPTVQWQVSTDAGANWSNVGGETNTTLTLTQPTVAQTGNRYRAVFTNTCSGTQTATTNAAVLTVSQKSVVGSFTAANKTYDGDVTASILTRTLTGQISGDDVSLSSGSATFDTKNVGTGKTVTGTGFVLVGTTAGNYSLSSSTLTTLANITARPVTVTADATTKTYGDSDPALTYQVTSGSLAFSDAVSGALSRVSGENVGTYAIQLGTLTLGANYDLTFVGASLTITARPVTATADAKTKVYGDSDPALTYQVTSGSLVGEDVFTGGLSRDAGENVGTYAIHQGTLTLGTNYDLTFVGANLTVTTRPVTVTADAKTKVYGDADTALTYQVTSGSLAFSDTFSGTLSRAAGENVGTYAIQQGTLALNSNYDLSFTGATLTIDPRAVTVTADAKSKTYGDPDPSLTYQVTGTLAFSDTFSGALTRAAGETVGAHAIQQGTLALSSNYALSYVGADLTIGKRTVVGHFTAAGKPYDGNVSATILTRTLENVLSDDGLVLTGGTATFEDKNVGANKLVTGTGFSLGGNDVANYTLASSTLTTNASIDRKPLVVSATGHNKVYDGTIDATVTLSDDRLSGDVLTTSYSAAAFADKNVGNGKPVSVSGILVGGTDSGNYAPNTTAAAAANITPRAASVAADAKSKIYGSPNPPLTATVGGIVSGDTLSFTLATAAVTLSGVGSYPITVTLGLNPNYSVTSSNNMLMVGKAMPAMVVTSSANPSTVNGTVNFTATVPSPTSGTPTGTVQFQVDGVNFGGPVALASGIASSGNTNILSVGPHAVTASYTGDLNFFGTVATLTGGQVVDNPTCFVCDTASSIPARFNHTSIPAGRVIWFNNVMRVRHVGHADNDKEEDDRDDGDEDDNDENEVWEAMANGSKPVTIRFDNQMIRFTSGGVVYNLQVPNGQVTFSPTATTATTTFNASTNTWESVVPTSGLTGRLFASGLAYPVPVNFPGDINPVTWTARITSDVAGLRVRWRWSAAVYSTFSANYNALGVKPVSDNRLSVYANRDRAGTPENFKQYLANGGRSYGHNHVGWRTRSATTLQCGVGFWSSYTQSNWAAKPKDNNAGTLLTANFASVYGGGLTIGSSAGFKLTFTSADAIRAFLPAGGKAGVLQATASNPTNSKAGVFAGQVLALRLNVDFSTVGVLPVGLATLRVVDGPLAGRSVLQVLDLANQVLSGDTAALASNGLSSVTQLNDIVTNINENYERGTVDRGFLWP